MCHWLKKKKEKKSYEKAKQNYFFVDKKTRNHENRIKKSFVLGIAKRSLVTFNQKRVVRYYWTLDSILGR